MAGLDPKTRIRVGELAASPLDCIVSGEIRSVLTTALRSSRASSSGGTKRSRRTRKELK